MTAESVTKALAGLSVEDAKEALTQLAERFESNVTPRKPAMDWAKAVADGRADENADGVLILRLRTPIEHAGEKVTRVTMQRVRVKDMRRAEVPSAIGIETDMMLLTAALVEPACFDSLESNDDANLFIAAAAHQLGKFMGVPPATSATPSASSGGTSGSPRVI